MAYAAFADAPVDVAVVEVGMGGSWDATNVADGAVAVVLPIAVDHARYLGDTPAEIAVEKAGIIKPGAVAVLAEQQPDVAEVLLAPARRGRRDASLREGLDFGVVSRVPAVGGQVVSLQGLRARYDEVFLPLYGAHQAQNAAVALAAVEAFVGDASRSTTSWCAAAFAEVTSPGRLEIVRAQPDDRARRRAQPARRRGGRGGARGLVHVRPADRRDRRDGRQGRTRGCWRRSSRTSRTSSAPRTPPSARCRPSELAAVAREVFGEDRVTVEPRLADAIDQAAGAGRGRRGVRRRRSAPARVLVTGSVVTVGEARSMLRPEHGDASTRPSRERSPRRGMCAAVLASRRSPSA